MDKNFNDQELSDIMKEIEALEEGFTEPVEDQISSHLMEELAELDESQAVPMASPKVVSLDAAKPKAPPVATASAPSPSTSMSFSVQGQINIDLNFDIGGKVVHLEVSQQGLNIVMDGGVTFFVPVADAKKAV